MKRLLCLCCTFSLLILNTGSAAETRPDAPLRDFRLPMFNEFGHRIWDLRAATVRVLTEKADRFELSNVHLRVLAGDPDGSLEIELFAPHAVVDEPARTVSGEGQLHVIGRDVELFGNDWICHADKKTIVIERDVVVTFTSDLGNILQ